MTRLLALTLVALAAVPAAAQGPPAAIPLTLEPAAAPVPALKYHLLPDLRAKTSGNAALLYYRAFSPEWQTHRQNREFMIRLSETASKPLRSLDPKALDEFSSVLRSRALQEVDRGARRTYCDWELLDRLREEGIGLLLPDLQGLREFGVLLKMRAREELLAGKFDQAARTIQTGLALARHITEGPTLIHALVGAAIASGMLEVVEDWVERPGAPNLYWALANLPRPLIDIRNGLQGERLVIDSLFPGYREWLDNPAKLPTLRTLKDLRDFAAVLQVSDPTWEITLLTLRTYPKARRFLRELGRSASQVDAMSPLQVVFLYEVRQYDLAYDDILKWAALPYPEAAPQLHRIAQQMKSNPDRGALAALLLPAVEKVAAVSPRLERKVAALRCIEAIRLHAAAHGGKLPASLAEVAEVPIPADPYLGKPFSYKVEGDKATLGAPPPAGEVPTRSNSLVYELTFRTKEKK